MQPFFSFSCYALNVLLDRLRYQGFDALATAHAAADVGAADAVEGALNSVLK